MPQLSAADAPCQRLNFLAGAAWAGVIAPSDGRLADWLSRIAAAFSRRNAVGKLGEAVSIEEAQTNAPASIMSVTTGSCSRRSSRATAGASVFGQRLRR
jgi:hypothetical protein